MNDTRDDSENFSRDRQRRAGRDSNLDKRREDTATTSAQTDKSPSAATLDDAFPDRIRRKYYVVANKPERDESNGVARLYADERGEYLAFKVTEDRLVTRLAAAEVIRDMVSVAQHRQWEALHVRGSVEFRREAWLEAGARGIEVRGYQPTDLDRQALADRREVWNRTPPRTHEVGVGSTSDKDTLAERLDYDKGVSGRLIEVSRAPYRNRSDAETTTYVTIELDNGLRHQVWGVGLEKAAADSKASPGDRIQVRRDGVERVAKDIKVIDAANGSARIERRQVPRNRWQVTAETIRTADRQTAKRDADPVAAQSHMVIVEKALERVFPENERARQSVLEVAKERIEYHLKHGHSFARAAVLDRVQEHQRSGTEKREVRRAGPSRTREQER
ncbi:LPD7 domain-containing protein [Bradyrhizobium sp. USDA 10063]